MAARRTEAKAARQVLDYLALRAAAHPLRWALVEVLTVEQTATATRCAQLLDESVNKCSFHLRVLRKHGFVEEAPAADARERPWRLTGLNFGWGEAEASADPQTQRAARALTSVFIEREARRQQTWLRVRDRYPLAWQRAAGSASLVAWMTCEELTELGRELVQLFTRYQDRTTDPASRPPGAELVRLYAVTMPLPPIRETK